jgi:response regulator RpfG family c-di-GMP phosphodiesterase
METKSKPVIMLIDDSSTNNILYESILSDEGYEIIICEGAASALKRLEKDVPDLILLDLMMPGMDGFSFIEKKNQNSKWQHIPVLMLTARIDSQSEDKAYKMGVLEYLIKPIGISEITEKIKKILEETKTK